MVSEPNSILPVMDQTSEELPPPNLQVEEERDNYGRFSIFPLENGWGSTLGNALRRILLHSLTGAAITWAKVDNVSHEFSSVPHMREEVIDLLMNLKGIRLRAHVKRPGRLRLEVRGQGEVKAGDIMAAGGDFEIVNPAHHLASLVHDDATLSVEMNVENGVGFRQANHDKSAHLPVDAMRVDAVFSPVRQAAYRIEQRRHMSRNDVECLILEVWTDGTRTAQEASIEALSMLRDTCHVLASATGSTSATATSSLSPTVYNTSISSLGLSARTQNSLSRAGIERIGQVLEKSKAELLALRNFGIKSYNELFDKFRSMDILPPEEDAGEANSDTEGNEA